MKSIQFIRFASHSHKHACIFQEHGWMKSCMKSTLWIECQCDQSPSMAEQQSNNKWSDKNKWMNVHKTIEFDVALFMRFSPSPSTCSIWECEEKIREQATRRRPFINQILSDFNRHNGKDVWRFADGCAICCNSKSIRFVHGKFICRRHAIHDVFSAVFFCFCSILRLSALRFVFIFHVIYCVCHSMNFPLRIFWHSTENDC